jgi:simple sugar transport system ATP-binding protein
MFAIESLPWLFARIAEPGGRLTRVALDWRVRALVESSSLALYGSPERSGAAALTFPIMTSDPLWLSVVECLFTNERNYAQGSLAHIVPRSSWTALWRTAPTRGDDGRQLTSASHSDFVAKEKKLILSLSMCCRARLDAAAVVEVHAVGERSNSVVRLAGVSKFFGAIHALNDVSLEIGHSEVVGLMGDNGAGKSTLVKILAGNYLPTAGSYFIEDKAVSFANPAEARDSGIEVVYQDLALCNNLTAAANVFLGREIMRGSGLLRWLDHKAMAKRAEVLFRELQSETRARDLVERMSGGQRQAVAIARTRLADAKLVLMDEPTAAISVRQVAQVLALINRLRDQGHSVVLISHRMPDVFASCDRVVVLRRGRKVADKPISTSSPEEVTGLITGAIHEAA